MVFLDYVKNHFAHFEGLIKIVHKILYLIFYDCFGVKGRYFQIFIKICLFLRIM